MNYLLSFLLLLSSVNRIQSFTFPSSSQKINENLTFYWEFLKNDTLMMAIDHRCNETGWVSLGFNGSGMSKIDMVSFEFSLGYVDIYDRYSLDYVIPAYDYDLGGTSDYYIADSYRDPYGRWYTKYYRVYDTGDPYDTIIYPRVSFQMIWAYGPTPKMQYHGAHRGTIQFDLVRPPGDDDNDGSQNGLKTAFDLWYKLGMFIAWGFLIDLPLILVHFLKTKKKVVAVHKVTSIASGVIGTGAALSQLIISFELNTFLQVNLSALHAWLGLIVGFLGAFLLIEGILLSLQDQNQDSQKSTNKKKNIHQGLGYVLYIAAKIYIAVDVYLFEKRWLYALIVAYCLLAFNHAIVMFVQTGWKKDVKPRRKEETKTTIEQTLLEAQRQF